MKFALQSVSAGELNRSSF